MSEGALCLTQVGLVAVKDDEERTGLRFQAGDASFGGGQCRSPAGAGGLRLQCRRDVAALRGGSEDGGAEGDQAEDAEDGPGGSRWSA
jgi:hypothetical protein